MGRRARQACGVEVIGSEGARGVGRSYAGAGRLEWRWEPREESKAAAL